MLTVKRFARMSSFCTLACVASGCSSGSQPSPHATSPTQDPLPSSPPEADAMPAPNYSPCRPPAAEPPQPQPEPEPQPLAPPPPSCPGKADAFPAPTGTTIDVPAGGDLQAALDGANPGDEIVLAAGAVF